MSKPHIDKMKIIYKTGQVKDKSAMKKRNNIILVIVLLYLYLGAITDKWLCSNYSYCINGIAGLSLGNWYTKTGSARRFSGKKKLKLGIHLLSFSLKPIYVVWGKIVFFWRLVSGSVNFSTQFNKILYPYSCTNFSVDLGKLACSLIFIFVVLLQSAYMPTDNLICWTLYFMLYLYSWNLWKLVFND